MNNNCLDGAENPVKWLKWFQKPVNKYHMRDPSKPLMINNSWVKLLYIFFCCSLFICCSKQNAIKGFSPTQGDDQNSSVLIENDFRFNGYTTYWKNVHQQRYRYGNFFRLNIPDVRSAVIHAKADVSVTLGLPGLQLQEGFIHGLLTEDPKYRVLDNPTMDELNAAVGEGNVLVYADTTTVVGKELAKKKDESGQKERIVYQANGINHTCVSAFVLRNRKRTLFAVVGTSQDKLTRFRSLLENTMEVISDYDMKRGWFGAQTLIKSVTCTPGTPVDVMGIGLNEGNSWFVFDGYMEFLAQKEIDDWVTESGLPIVSDVGFPPIYGCTDYEELQVQLMFTPQDWIEYAKSKNGYVFRQVDDKQEEDLIYNGYYANPGNVRQINNEDKPFVIQTGDLLSGATSHMVLFNKKGDPFDKVKLWDAIMNRRAVAIADGVVMMGDEDYRNALQMLFLDRIYMENYFGDRINMETKIEKNKLTLSITNLYNHPLQGDLKIDVPPQLSIEGELELSVRLKAGESGLFTFTIEPTEKSMNRSNVVSFSFDWGGQFPKYTMVNFNLPPAVSVHKLLYGTSSGIRYPVSVHNFTTQDSLDIEVKVVAINEPLNTVFETEEKVYVMSGDYCDIAFDLELPEGNYLVFATALGVTAETQLGIERSNGHAIITEVDLNDDGISEYIMENERVKAILLTVGGRIIEYIVKEKKDNVFFKLWPEKPDDDRRPYRDRGFYPYGGFEDFLGQPSIETHRIYDATIMKSEGEYVAVKMRADYHGNTIQKTYILYGNTPLLEARFEMKMINPELNMMGPQPIIELGEKHGPEDLFIIPEKDGLHEYRMRTDRYYGMKLDISEGWNAAYDSSEDISFFSAFPVSQPIFLHLWMNHPSNPDAQYFYAELQPWIPLLMRTTTYFSYYFWADSGSWKNTLNEMKRRNLITKRE